MTEEYETLVRIPVHFVDGAWVTETGRRLTASDGTTAEFVLSKNALLDLCQEPEVHPRKSCQFLDQGATLRIALRVRQPDELTEALMNILIAPEDMLQNVEWGTVKGWHSTEAHFVEIDLGEPTNEQRETAPNFAGGLLVKLRGDFISEITPSTFNLPDGISETKPRTLNHAYTILSELYETHRASHTGSIYQTVFYQGEDERWYPLGHLKELGNTKANGALVPSEKFAEEFWSSVRSW